MAARRDAGFLLAASLSAMAALAWTAPRAQQTPADHAIVITEEDWPCHGRYRPAFSAAAFWQGPSLDGMAVELEQRPETRKLAERIVAPETGQQEAETSIAGFAAEQPGEEMRRRALTVLFVGVIAEANLYRRFILEGIVASVGRGRLAAAALAESELAIQDLADDPAPSAEAGRDALEQRRFWRQRAFEQASGEARFLCHRLTSLEGKVGRLARAIAGYL